MNQYQLSGASMLEIEAFINKELLANLPQNYNYHTHMCRFLYWLKLRFYKNLTILVRYTLYIPKLKMCYIFI
jgi:hypothetical protein